MVMLMTDDAFNTEEDMDVEVIDGRNGYDAAKRQAILDAVHLHFPELSAYIETWYLSPLPLWFFMDNNTLAITWSSEGVQQGDPLSSFLFSLIYKPVLERIETTLKQPDPRTQVLAILDDYIINIGARFTQIAFQIATEALQTINIHTV